MYIYKNNTTSTTNMTYISNTANTANTTNTLELPLTSLGDEDWRFNDYDFHIWN